MPLAGPSAQGRDHRNGSMVGAEDGRQPSTRLLSDTYMFRRPAVAQEVRTHWLHANTAVVVDGLSVLQHKAPPQVIRSSTSSTSAYMGRQQVQSPEVDVACIFESCRRHTSATTQDAAFAHHLVNSTELAVPAKCRAESFRPAQTECDHGALHAAQTSSAETARGKRNNGSHAQRQKRVARAEYLGHGAGKLGYG